MADFQYSALPPIANTIRLLQIHSAEALTHPISCELIDVSLNDHPEFAALSYTWGQPIFDHFITCNHQRLGVTAHLYLALRRLRQSKWPLVWVDAICINQKNVPERNQQVLRMGSLYTQAARVYVYFGELDGLTEQTVDLMECLHTIWTESVGRNVHELKRMTCDSLEERSQRDRIIRFMELRDAGFPGQNYCDLPSAGLPHPLNPLWGEMKSFFLRSWFIRMWVIQELALGSDVYAILGHLGFPWEFVVSSVRCLARGLDNFTAPPALPTSVQQEVMVNYMKATMAVVSMSMLKETSTSRKLIHLISRSRNSQCADSRDKVYSLLGLASDTEGAPAPNYLKPVEEIYCEYARHFVSVGDGLDMLVEAGLEQGSGPSEAISLPSWAPNWMHDASGRFGLERSFFHAAGQTQVTLKLEDDASRLSVRGFALGLINKIGPEFLQARNAEGFTPSGLRNWEKELRAIAQETSAQSKKWTDTYAITLKTGSISLLKNGSQLKSDTEIASLANEHYLAYSRETRDSRDYMENIGTLGRLYSFCTTVNGHMGWVPKSAQQGDLVCIFLGGPVPFVIRENTESYILVGTACITGMMQGEALNMNIETQDFVLE